MQQLMDITGNQYGHLTVLGFSHMGNRRKSFWKCKCNLCGKEKVMRKDSFAYKYSHSVSCGCYHRLETKGRKRSELTGRFIKMEV